MTAHRILFVVMGLAVLACAGGSTSPSLGPVSTAGASTTATAAPSSAALVLHVTPDNLGCDSIGIDYTTMTFHIDPAAIEQVSATTDTGVSLVTYWPASFTGDASERTVRDAAGKVVASDGEVVDAGAQLHGYHMCLAPTKIYVMLERPGG